MENLILRSEEEKDFRTVEEVTREAFWNLYAPGCDEHYLVHQLRNSPDFIIELSLVAEIKNRIVGSIFYSKSHVETRCGEKFETITFGPVSVLPEYQNQGIGKTMIEHSVKMAKELGHRAVIIYGYPGYYQRFGFRPAKNYGISSPDGRYPVAHQVLELYEGALEGIQGKAYESPLFHINAAEAQDYDKSFPAKEKKVTDTQKTFQQTASSFL